MRKFILFLSVLFLAAPVFADGLPAGVFPWGAYSNYRGSSAERDSMRDTLGLNFINLAWDKTRPSSHIVEFMNDDMVVYPNQGPVINPSDSTNYFVFAEAHYSMIYANDDSSQVRFYERNSLGSDPLYGFFPYEDDTSNTHVVVLDSLCYKQEKVGALDAPSPTEYHRRLHMRIDTTGVTSTDTVAILFTYNCGKSGENRTPVDSVFIAGGEFSDSSPVLVDCGNYTMGDSSYTSFAIVSTCKTEVYFEFLKIYCDEGGFLIDNHYRDDGIMQSAATLFGGEYVAGWHMSDEPFYDNFLPMRYIDNLIMEATSGDEPRAVTDWSITSAGEYTRDFIQIAKPEVIWADPYQFYGGQKVECEGEPVRYWRFTQYAGNAYGGSTPPYWGLQRALRATLSEPAEIIRSACADAGIDWWFVTQAFSWYFLDCDTCTYDSNPAWRMPTQSELSCILYMGLCYNARGIVFWHYHSNTDDNGNCPDVYTEGFKDSSGSYTPAWYGAYEANRYMKAIDDTYMDLTWDSAYYVKPDSAMPDGWIDTIYAVSNDTIPNQDLGWFHVGQYTEGNDKYIMIVNRACSQDSITPDPAPSITATIKFDTSDLALGNYVQITDIADSIDYISYDSVLVFPKITLTTSSGGQISYTTQFDPGEGRLFKLAEVEVNSFPNPLYDSLYVSKGAYLLTTYWRIREDAVVVLEPGTTIYFEGEADKIIVMGKIYANGTFSDSIYFLPWNEVSDPDSAGDWSQLQFSPDSSYGEFSYCSIQYAATGIELREVSKVIVSHCSIGNSEFHGIINFSGNLVLSDSYIAKNGVDGLYAKNSVDTVMNNAFYANGPYGIVIDGANQSNSGSYIYGNEITQPSEEDNSLYGIYVSDNDYVTIEDCLVKHFDQGGILLDDSAPEIIKCDLISNVYFGIYAENGGEPKIYETVFDTMEVCLKAVNGASPVLGREPDTSLNAFYYCPGYFVYFADEKAEYPDTLWAQNCWWNREEPDLGKFYSDDEELRIIVYEPWLEEDPSPKLAAQIPLKFELHQNYPNPFNPNTIISFSLEKPANTVVTVYNILGQVVARPVNDYLEAGNHSIIWEGKNNSGSPVASGVYFYTIQTGDHFDSKKMLLLK